MSLSRWFAKNKRSRKPRKNDLWGCLKPDFKKKKEKTLSMAHFKKMHLQTLGCYLRLNAGLRCIFERLFNLGYSQDLSHKNGLVMKTWRTLTRVRARPRSRLLQHLSVWVVTAKWRAGIAVESPALKLGCDFQTYEYGSGLELLVLQLPWYVMKLDLQSTLRVLHWLYSIHYIGW